MHTRTSSLGKTVVAAAMALAASAGACGGGGGQSPPPNCLQVLPCGGDVVGSWSFLGTCLNIQAQSADRAASCPGAKINAAGVSLTGALNFTSDLTYTATNWHEVFVITETVPLSCAQTVNCTDGNGTETDTASGTTVSMATIANKT